MQDEDDMREGGEVLEIGNGDDLSDDVEAEEEEEEEEEEEAMQQQRQAAKQVAQNPSQAAGEQMKGQEVKNNMHDLAIDVSDDGEELKSDEEEEEDDDDGTQNLTKTQNQKYQQWQQDNKQKGSSPQAPQPRAGQQPPADDEQDDDKPVEGAYNPADYAGLQVSAEVREVFEYIQRYKPQKVELESKLKPFVPEFFPAVGEVDAFLKMQNPLETAQGKEQLGLHVLDEPALNCEEKAVLEMKYIQSKNVTLSGAQKSQMLEVKQIEQAEKKPKEIMKWIEGVEGLHQARPAVKVNYSKAMGNPDELMEEWPREMQEALRQIQFPGPEIDMSAADYGKLICSMLDIPTHKLSNNKSHVESLHVLFTLYQDLKENQFIQNHPGQDLAQF